MTNSELKLYLFKEMLEGRSHFWLTARLGYTALFDPFKFVIKHMPGPSGLKLRQLYYRQVFGKLGKNSLIDVGVEVSGEENVYIDEYTWIDSYVRMNCIFGELHIGKRIHVAPNCILSAGGGLTLEDYVGLAPGVQIHTNSEAPMDGKRMSGPMIPERYKAFVRKPVLVKRDAFLGAGCIVLPGVTIGEGAVVAANSVVNRDVADWTIVAGSPARPVSKREKVTVPDI